MPPKKKPGKLVVAQDEAQPVEREVLAAAIVRLSRAARDLARRSGLNRAAIVTLLAHSTRLGRRTIEDVLNAIEQLERDYCR